MELEAIWSEYRISLKRFLHAKVSDPDEVDDLLQEILIKTHKNLGSIKSEDSIKSWLFQIANHTIIDFYRKKSKTHDLSSADLWYKKEDTETQQTLVRCIEPFIQSLPEETAALLIAVDLQGQSQKQDIWGQSNIKYCHQASSSVYPLF